MKPSLCLLFEHLKVECQKNPGTEHFNIMLKLTNFPFCSSVVFPGTSLPDLFASKQAATSEATADNSVGNVTGSNSVNVFLGLGLPWTLAAIYHYVRTVSPLWRAVCIVLMNSMFPIN